MTDLEFASTEQLIAELKRRCAGVVVAHTIHGASGREPFVAIQYHYATADIHTELAITLAEDAANWLEKVQNGQRTDA